MNGDHFNPLRELIDSKERSLQQLGLLGVLEGRAFAQKAVTPDKDVMVL